mmetsp:Transcript_93857/g.265154  ORF Transcript_93857/g.265154 Transcript_93857/m.265154 type:complete len:365 (-) Transcript_93857:456-1550(-)
MALPLTLRGVRTVLVALRFKSGTLVLFVQARGAGGLFLSPELAGAVLALQLGQLQLQLRVVHLRGAVVAQGVIDEPLLLRALLQQLHDALLRLELRLLVLLAQLRQLILECLPLFLGNAATGALLELRRKRLLAVLVQVLGAAFDVLYVVGLGLYLLQLFLQLVLELFIFFLLLAFGLLRHALRSRRPAGQRVDDRLLFSRFRVRSWRVPIYILYVLVRVALQQLQDHCQVAVVGRVVQRRVAVVVLKVDRDVRCETQRHHDITETSSSSFHEWGAAARCGDIRICTAPEQRRNAHTEAFRRSVHQRSVPALVLRIDEVGVPQLGAVQEPLDDLRVAIVRGKDQSRISVLVDIIVHGPGHLSRG